jgi:hypothetical protein
MKVFTLVLGMIIGVFLSCSPAVAGDFDWLEGLNVRASSDPSGFRAQLATRFRIGDTQISAVLSNVDRPADAYMVFRLGEMSSHPPEYVLKEYRAGKGKGWGVIAKSLGIKPGSKEFHALKSGSDLYSDDSGKGQGKGKGKGKGKH